MVALPRRTEWPVLAMPRRCAANDCEMGWRVRCNRAMARSAGSARKHWRSSNFNRNVLERAYLEIGWRDADGHGRWTWHSLRHVFCTTALFTWKLHVTDVSRMAGPRQLPRHARHVRRLHCRCPRPRPPGHRLTTPGTMRSRADDSWMLTCPAPPRRSWRNRLTLTPISPAANANRRQDDDRDHDSYARRGGVPIRFRGGVDRAICISTAIAVLAVAGVAAHESYWHAYAVIWAHGESGATARPGAGDDRWPRLRVQRWSSCTQRGTGSRCPGCALAAHARHRRDARG